MSTAIIAMIILAIIAGVTYKYVKNLRAGSSCCTDGDGPLPKKIKVKDRNPNHYSHQTTLIIDGMTCSHCVRNVENALNALPGIWAEVNLGEKSAELLSKEPFDENILKKAVRESGYTVIRITEHEE